MELSSELKEQIYSVVRDNSSSNCEVIILGNLLELRMNNDCIDVYRYNSQDFMNDDYDFDSDYLTTIYY